MVEVTEGVYFIQGQDEMIPDSHVYLIGMPSSEDLTLVDAGLVGKGNYKLQSVVKAGVKLSSIKRVIMTHTHLDLMPSKRSRSSKAMTDLSTACKCSNRCARRNTGSRMMPSNSRCIGNCREERVWRSGA